MKSTTFWDIMGYMGVIFQKIVLFLEQYLQFSKSRNEETSLRIPEY
jgi:hypothetical protein